MIKHDWVMLDFTLFIWDLSDFLPLKVKGMLNLVIPIVIEAIVKGNFSLPPFGKFILNAIGFKKNTKNMTTAIIPNNHDILKILIFWVQIKTSDSKSD